MPEPSDLLIEAGFLLLEQNRVSVSVLQRRFEVDFDAATEVLDQLQALGLIGPYLGGRTRDILLSREEWIEVVRRNQPEETFEVRFDPRLTPEEIRELLLAYGDHFRACGGVGFTFRFESDLAKVPIEVER